MVAFVRFGFVSPVLSRASPKRPALCITADQLHHIFHGQMPKRSHQSHISGTIPSHSPGSSLHLFVTALTHHDISLTMTVYDCD